MKKILVVDDHPDAADLLVSILLLQGHTALAVYGAVEGLQAVSEFAPEIVFLDIGMPILDGYEVVARIRRDCTIRQPYMIAFTAWDDVASVARALHAGFDLHVKKTSPFDVLAAAIDQATAE
ncbi:response regulator [Duganella levis]|uniref:Response regulator n=1 Tax=Duganella levis TaxID=2692169 RepID=A0ABW9VT66_9BURK|nr:response regulator [Duganella levis]MYN24826.1 response regulator [Duganella levis]